MLATLHIGFAAVLALSAAAAAPDPATAPLHLPPPPSLSPLAREALQHRMDNHGQELQVLLAAVLMLDEPLVQSIANQIAAAPKLADVGGQDGTLLNSSLPRRFFVLQDQLTTQAKSLSRAAKSGNKQAIASAFGKLTATCVRCHAVYLGDPDHQDDAAQGP